MRHQRLSLTVLTLALLTTAPGTVRAGDVCTHWLPGPLHNQSAGIETTGIISASAIWTPATGGSFLVVGGSFVTAGGVTVNNIAAWDGASWRALGSGTPGTNGTVLALAVFNGDLIACGAFSQAGGTPATNIARFNGTNWQPLTGPLGEGVFDGAPSSLPRALALAVFNNELIVGGHFLKAGGVAVTNIAKWNGSAWNRLNGMPPEIGGVGLPDQVLASVSSLRVHVDGKLYIGGNFSQAGGLAATGVVGFANGAYFLLGNGLGGAVITVQSFGNDVVVCGNFSQMGGVNAANVARWTPATNAWSAMGSGLGNPGGLVALSLQPFNGQLVAGGTFNGGVSTWNGSTWSTVGGGVSGGVPPQQARVFTLNVFDGKLVAAGNFTTAGSNAIQHIAQWNLSNWSALQAPTPQVLAFDTLGSRLIAAGSFLQSTTSQTPANNIIGWNGATLTRVQTSTGEGTNGTIRAIKSYSGGGADRLVVGGDFTVAGGLSANRIAQYSQPLLSVASWTALGAGFNNSVNAIERFNNATYAGGTFTQSGGTGLNRIARFDGTNWVALGSGVDGPVNAMKIFNGFLYVGGEFDTAGGVGTGCLARWNGSAWSTYSGIVGNVLADGVTALEVHNNKLYIGNRLGPGFHVLEYNGTTTPLVGTANGIISNLKSDGQHLYVLGGFTTIGGINANHIARWNATDGWSDVEGGTNDVVNTLGLFHGEIQVGLGISLAFNGPELAAPQPGKGWVRYNPTGTPWVSSNPVGQTVNCGQTVMFTAQPALGYSTASATWRRNAVPLTSGPSGHGSIINGANSNTLIIFNTRSTDAGSYDCVFSNLCGSVTSSAAPLMVNGCCASDVTGNGVTDIDDLVATITAWGQCPALPVNCLADVNGSGAVDIDDLVMVITGWGACP